MDNNKDSLMSKLSDANPYPIGQLNPDEKQRSKETLVGIFAEADTNPETPVDLGAHRQKRHKRRSPWYTAAAAVGVIALAGALLPQIVGNDVLESPLPKATAEEILHQAADASAQQPDVAEVDVTGVEVLQRTDRDNNGSVTTHFETDTGGMMTSEVQIEGSPGPELQEFANNPEPQIPSQELMNVGADAEALRTLAEHEFGDVAMGSLHLLLHPALSAEQQKILYDNLARAGGNDLAHVNPSPTGGDDEIVSIIREEDQMSFDIIPTTGQLTRAVGLMGSGITTTVESTAILGCVHVTGLNGPEVLSMACADNNYTLVDLEWSRWGAEEATSTGRAFINNCDPYCAEGTFEEFDVNVTAYMRENCGYNAEVYTRLYVEFDDGNSERNETFDMGCVVLPLHEE